MLLCIYLDLLALNLVCFVLENGNYVLENNISLAVGTMSLFRFAHSFKLNELIKQFNC